MYLDVAEYERIRNSGSIPETWCTTVTGFWVQIVPAIVYELEYRNMISDDEKMSLYIEVNLETLETLW